MQTHSENANLQQIALYYQQKQLSTFLLLTICFSEKKSEKKQKHGKTRA